MQVNQRRHNFNQEAIFLQNYFSFLDSFIKKLFYTTCKATSVPKDTFIEQVLMKLFFSED